MACRFRFPFVRFSPGALVLAFALASFGGPGDGHAADGALTPAQAQAVRDLVRSTLVEDPSIIKEALTSLQRSEREQETVRSAEAIRQLAPVLNKPEGLTAMGNPDGDVTVLVFSDYNCGYCKQVLTSLREVMKADPGLRLYVLELPILGPDSVEAARLALAANAQGKYEKLHRALIEHRGRMDAKTLLSIAQAEGLDVERLKKDAQSADVERIIAQSYGLAEALGVSGTPAFVIGQRLVPGAVPKETMIKLINEARATQAKK